MALSTYTQWLLIFVRQKAGTQWLKCVFCKLFTPSLLWIDWCDTYILETDLDILEDPSFAEFRATLDLEMKKVLSLGISSKIMKAKPLRTEEEELLWQAEQLGDHPPWAPVVTMRMVCTLPVGWTWTPQSEINRAHWKSDEKEYLQYIHWGHIKKSRKCLERKGADF